MSSYRVRTTRRMTSFFERQKRNGRKVPVKNSPHAWNCHKKLITRISLQRWVESSGNEKTWVMFLVYNWLCWITRTFIPEWNYFLGVLPRDVSTRRGSGRNGRILLLDRGSAEHTHMANTELVWLKITFRLGERLFSFEQKVNQTLFCSVHSRNQRFVISSSLFFELGFFLFPVFRQHKISRSLKNSNKESALHVSQNVLVE